DVDVGDGLQVFVEKASEKQAVLHRIDVREPNQIADDRADRRAASAARWQTGPAAHRAFAAYFLSHLRGLLLQVSVDEKKAGQVVFRDELEFVGELTLCLGAQRGVGAIGWIAIVESTPAERGQHLVGGRVTFAWFAREVRKVVAEVAVIG